MAGVSITVEFHGHEFRDALKRLAGPYTGLLRAIGVGFVVLMSTASIRVFTSEREVS